jgi:hypothetical protein
MLAFFGAVELAIPTITRSNRATKDLFPSAAIPSAGSTPVRPVVEFFLGAPPVWSDIYSGVLHKTSYYNRIRDAINSGKHAIVIGVPACGKTTLLMELAATIAYEGHKLIFDSITDEQARHISARLAGDHALVFLDNCCDSIDALQFLAKCGNIRIVGADRDYNFGFVSHRLQTKGFEVMDATELTPADIQGCLSCIPDVLTSRKYRLPDRHSLAKPSLFEIIEANILRATLRERFRGVLDELRRNSPTHHDVLIMISYVQLCRVPVSLDMLIAYLRDYTQDWRVVVKLRDELGAMIADYSGALTASEPTQDYFVPRSTLVGETIVDVADDASLKRVLVKFHKELSPYRICRYDVFRRHAYDADIFVRAFPYWEEGKHFYEKLYSRDLSPFMLQQSALYLSRKKQHGEAFQMIDRAIVESGGRQLTIRNSHAIIMFRKNIEYSSDPAARQSLRESMATLTECYEWDKRRLFHAVTFARQALEFFRAVGDDETRDYLATAKAWLEEEMKTTPWSWEIKKLLPEIRRIVG